MLVKGRGRWANGGMFRVQKGCLASVKPGVKSFYPPPMGGVLEQPVDNVDWGLRDGAFTPEFSAGPEGFTQRTEVQRFSERFCWLGLGGTSAPAGPWGVATSVRTLWFSQTWREPATASGLNAQQATPCHCSGFLSLPARASRTSFSSGALCLQTRSLPLPSGEGFERHSCAAWRTSAMRPRRLANWRNLVFL